MFVFFRVGLRDLLSASYYDKCNAFTDCEAKAAVSIKLVGPGKCTAKSKAFCKVYPERMQKAMR